MCVFVVGYKLDVSLGLNSVVHVIDPFFILFVTLNGFIKVHERFDPLTHVLYALVSSVVSGGLHHAN